MALYNVPLSVRLEDEREILDQRFEKWGERLRVACPGIIQSFDSVKQTVTVKLAIREMVSLAGKPYENLEIPILQDVPIYMPRAGNFVLTMPVTAGDECLVVFGDNCIDSWWESGKVSNQLDYRRHDLSDGFAIIGPWSQPRKISNYSTDSAVLRNLNNDSYVEVRDNDINIVTPTKVTVTAGSEIEVNAPTVDVNATDVTVDATNVKVVAQKTEVNSTTVQVTGGAITLNGSSGVTLIGGGLSSIDAKNFLGHVHSGVQGGLGNTGPVV
jgi:predicted RNA-binding protein with PIN domain